MFVISLRINHPSPLIYWQATLGEERAAENQSSIPFDILNGRARHAAKS